jgi:spherulation-specific family 4 protein
MAREPSSILVPAYEYPLLGDPEHGIPGNWDVLLDVGRKMRIGGLLVIVNNGNGPGYDNEHGHYTAPDTNYLREIRRLRTVCASVVGYVHDCYNNTKTDTDDCPRHTSIEDDIDRWFEAYNVDGIFIDEVDRANIPRAQTLIDMVQIRRNHALIVLNPGNIPTRDFMMQTDPAIVVIQEQSFAQYQGWPPLEADWVRERDGATGESLIPASRVAIIAHTPTGLGPVDQLVNVANRYSIRWIYAWHGVKSVYNPLSTYLPLLADRIASNLGFPPGPIRRVITPIVCKLRQVFKLVRT